MPEPVNASELTHQNIKVSVITVCFNSNQTISKTLRSVSSQTHQNIEHILVDGGSSDGTLETIQDFKHVAQLVSEKDKGIYDAMNKGIAMSNGEIISILNSDDLYHDHLVVENIVSTFIESKADIVYGDICYFKGSAKLITRSWSAGNFYKGSFAKGWHPPHPAVFIKKSLYLTQGLFDETIPISADFELLLRFFEAENVKVQYLKKYLVLMSDDGVSSGLMSILRGNIEVYRALKQQQIYVNPIFFIAKRLLSKIKQKT